MMANFMDCFAHTSPLQISSLSTPEHVKESRSINLLPNEIQPFYPQLMKWIGNKQRYAHRIVERFPKQCKTYYEPFLGSGSILSVVSPSCAVASDISAPLIGIWQSLKHDPARLMDEYNIRYCEFQKDNKYYFVVRDRFNVSPNPYDLLFLTRSCYGGILRFRQKDGYMTTPLGAHELMSPYEFKTRVIKWRPRILGAEFICSDFREVFKVLKPNDFIYCDPPYNKSQNIIYGSHSFMFNDLLSEIESAKYSGATVALSIDDLIIADIPEGLFDEVCIIDTGKKKLNNFHNKRVRERREELLLIARGNK